MRVGALGLGEAGSRWATELVAALGADVRFFDAGDYPLVESLELVDRLVHVYRELAPTVVLTHALAEPHQPEQCDFRVQLKRNLGLPHATIGGAYQRLYPQVTGVLA